MLKRVMLGTALVFAVAIVPAVSLFATADKNNKDDNGTHKVTLCHATHSAKNPYVKITVSVNAAGNFRDNGNGDHAHHTGPIATSQSVAEDLKKQHIHWGDIIPAGGHNTSLNWTGEGRAIFNNGCKYPAGAPVKTVKVEKPVKNTETETIVPVETTVTELPRTGGNSMAFALVAAGVAYLATSLAGKFNLFTNRSE